MSPVVRNRAVLQGAALFVFAGELTLFDIACRGVTPYVDQPRLVFTAAGSVLFGAFVASLTHSRALRALVAFAWAGMLTIEAIVFRHYHTMIDRQMLSSTVHAWSDVKPVVLTMLPGTVPVVLLVTFMHYVWLSALSPAGHAECFPASFPAWVPRIVRPRRRWPLVAGAALFIALGAPLRLGTPEVRLADALALAWPEKASAASGKKELALPPSTRRRLPNVLFILTESVRSEDYPGEYDPHSPIAPEMGALLEDRVVFRQMRAVASYTAVSVSALLSGRPQLGKRDDIVAAPMLFEFLRAFPEAPTLAYFSAQSKHLFERDDIQSMVTTFVSMETLLGHELDDEDRAIDFGMDRKVAVAATAALPGMRAPYFLMLHLGGTHAPYFVDKEHAPFEPWERTVTWSSMPALHNAYKNAIFEQDRSIAQVVRAFLAAQGASPWVVIFTSDHGESFGEHGAIHHGQNLYDEQIHVPAFIAFGHGALDPDEATRLRAHEDELVTHLDVLPTLLDIYGVPSSRFAGRSLLRANESPRAPLPVTNCTEMFPCPIATWGMLGADRSLVAQPWDRGFHCMDARGGRELTADEGCHRLQQASMAAFPQLPNGAPNR